MSWRVVVIPGRYADSVRLMGVARTLRERDGVAGCEVAMGTAANLEALATLGVSADAGPADVIIAIDCDDPGVADAALSDAEAALMATAGVTAGSPSTISAPHSLVSATRTDPSANVALISVPGEYAALEAHHAIGEGLHVFLFSDHVSVEDEVELKRRAAARGLLVMGPGCGSCVCGRRPHVRVGARGPRLDHHGRADGGCASHRPRG